MRARRAGSLALLLLGLALPSAGLPEGQAQDRRRWIETVVPRMESAEAQLGHARRLKRQLAGKEGDELAFWRALTVEAYQALRVFHPGARAASVEGAFRAGEILRTAGEDEAALEEFRWAIEHGAESEFRPRARLEVGHLHRRAERWRDALQAYLDAAADPLASASRREDSWLWVGSAWKALGRAEDARLVWGRIAEQGSEPLARITAFDELALLHVESGELEGAAGVLDRCLRALSPAALEETEEGERVRRALLRMRVVDELARAVARKKGSSGATGTSRKS